MLLSGEEIKKNLGTNIIIEPYSPSQLNPNSYNLRLSMNCWCMTPTCWT